MELLYLLSNGDLMKVNEIFKMPAHEFLFLSQYLLRKRKIENRPNKKEI